MKSRRDDLLGVTVLEPPVPSQPSVTTPRRGPRADQWVNPYTGFGTPRDRQIAGQYLFDALLTTTELDALYYGSDIAAKIVDFRPREMFRRGYEIRIDGTTDGDDQDSEIPDELMSCARNDYDLDTKILEAFIWGRLYGGCLMIFGINDGGDASEPLNEKTIRTLDYIHVVDRRFALALTYYADPLHPKFGYPETYQVGDPLFGNWSIVHETRCIRIDGVKVDARRRRANAGWGNSVLQRCYESMRDFSSAFQAIGFMLTDASQGIFKLKGLIEAIASNKEAAIQERMQLVDMTRGVARSVLLDMDEEFTKVPTTFTGLPDILDRYMLRLAAATDMPVSILMGRSPAGLHATGESDMRAFYSTVESEQKNSLKPLLLRAYKLIALAEGIKNIDGLDIYFPALWTPTDQEQAQLMFQLAQADNLYLQAGVLLPSEVALSRFGGAQLSLSTEIDKEAREAEKERDTDDMKNPPEEDPNAQLQGQPGAQPPNAQGPNPQTAPKPAPPAPRGGGQVPPGSRRGG